MTLANPGTARRRRLTGVAMVLVVLVLGGAASLGATQAVQRGQDRLETQAMNHHIEDLTEVIGDEVGHYRDSLTDLAASISAQDTLEADEFAEMTSRLNTGRLPGAAGVAFIVPAYDSQVAATQQLWRARGAEGLTLYRTGTDIEHKYVVFARSFSGVPQTPGRDLSSVPQSNDALRNAARTGAFTISSSYVLLRDRYLPPAQQQISFTMAVPVYESGTLLGWVTMGVRGGDFLTAALGGQIHDRIQLQLSDPSPDAVRTITSVTGGTLMNRPALTRTERILVGQHHWDLTLRPTTTLLDSSDRRMMRLTTLTGIAFTLLLALLVSVLAGGRNRAMDQVDAATAALRQDIERRQRLEEQLRHRESELQELAFHDQLTGLANRKLFYDRVGHALHTHSRVGRRFAVMFIDLDGFKLVNDQLGHSAGDMVLREVAQRLVGCLRDGDTVSRFGGDEFAVLVEQLAEPDDVRITADRIVAAVQKPIAVGPLQASVTASVGVALNRGGDTADDILREADLAMYTAKTTGKCRHVLAGS